MASQIVCKYISELISAGGDRTEPIHRFRLCSVVNGQYIRAAHTCPSDFIAPVFDTAIHIIQKSIYIYNSHARAAHSIHKLRKVLSVCCAIHITCSTPVPKTYIYLDVLFSKHPAYFIATKLNL